MEELRAGIKKLSLQQKYNFSVDCFDRVYPLMSHHDPQGILRDAVDNARTATRDAAVLSESQKAARKFVRKLCKTNPPIEITLIAKAGRECLEGNPDVVASLAAQTSTNPRESRWQNKHLQDMLLWDVFSGIS